MSQILSNDVIVSSSHSNLNKNLTNVLDQYNEDLNQLESNIKWLYKYGGVGGKGGDDDGTTTVREFSLICNINNMYSLSKNQKPISVNGTGTYNINVTIGRPQGFEYKVTATYTNTSTNKSTTKTINLNFERGYESTIQLNFSGNGKLYIKATCSGELDPQDLSIDIITNPYKFTLSAYNENHITQWSSNELMIDSLQTDGLHFKFDYELGVDSIIYYDIIDTSNSLDESLKTGSIVGTGIDREGTIFFPINSSLFVNNNAGAYTFKINITIENSETHDITKIDAEQNNLVINYFLVPSSLYLIAYGEKANTKLYSNKISNYESLYNEYIELINKKTLYENDKNVNPEFTDADQEALDNINNQITFVTNGVIGIKCKSYYGRYTRRTFNLGDSDHRGYIKIKHGTTEEYVDVHKVSIFEQEVFTITPYIPYTGEVEIEFILEYNNTIQSCKYYIYLVNNVNNLEWYNSTWFNPVEHNFYRSGLTSNSFSSLAGKSYVYSYSALENNKLFVEYTPSSLQRNEMIIQIGIQYNKVNPKINNELPKILEIIGIDEHDTSSSTNENTNKKIVLYQNEISFEGETKNIYIPTEENYDPANFANYHLISIIKRLINISNDKFYYEISIYIDGVLENTILKYSTSGTIFNKVLLYPANFSINLFEIVDGYKQSLTTFDSENHEIKLMSFVNDITIAQYWEKFKQEYLNQTNNKFINYLEALYNLYQNEDLKENRYKISLDDIQTIAKNVKTPTLILEVDLTSTDVSNFLTDWFTISYHDIKTKPLGVSNVMWSPGDDLAKDVSLEKINWFIEPQGTSTLDRKVKNLTLGIISEENETIFTPNFSMSDKMSFLPESSFTLKADIVDSSHCNNTAIGLFVNTVTSRFADAQQSTSIYKDHVKNCLVGFPVLLYIGTKKGNNDYEYHYYGIYNFNLGRESYFNLGYKSLSYLDRLGTLQEGFGIYTITKENQLPGLFVAEVLEGSVTGDNNGHVYDFSQYYNNVLMLKNNDGDDIGMWGKIKVANEVPYPEKLTNFVKSISKAGGFIFKYLHKNFDESEPYGYNYGYKRSKGTTGNDLTESLNYVPNFKYQAKRNESADNNPIYFEINNELQAAIESPDFLTAIGPDWLDDTILKYNSVGDDAPLLNPILDYESLVEYYVICMAFGLVDSVCKNLNIKSWNINSDNPKYYIAFYDMDTALGKNNKGGDVSYFAFSDYWKVNDKQTNRTDTVLADKTFIYRDFFPPTNTISGYDIPSSYLFAIAKYAVLLYGEDLFFNKNKFKSPQDLWCELRGKNNYLQNAKYFIDNFFNKNMKNIPEALITYNYRFKYLWTDQESFSSFELESLHGRGIYSVEDWLNNRLHILDAYFNLCDVDEKIQYYDLNSPETNKWKDTDITEPNLHNSIFGTEIAAMKNNPDVLVLIHAFTTLESSTTPQKTSWPNISIRFKTGELTPGYLVLGKFKRRMLFNNTNQYYQLSWSTSGNQDYFLGGSKLWTEITNIGPLVNAEGSNPTFTCISDYMQKITGDDGICKGWILNTPSLQYLTLTSSSYEGELTINNSFQNLKTLNISGSKIQLTVNESNITEIIANDIISPGVSITNCPNLTNISLNNAYIQNFAIDLNVANTIDFTKIHFNSLTLSADITDLNSQISLNGYSSDEINEAYSASYITVQNFRNIYLTNCSRLKSLVVTPNLVKKLVITESDLSLFTNTENADTGIYISDKIYDSENKLISATLHLEKLINLEEISFKETIGFTKIILPPRNIKLLSGAFYETDLTYINFADNDYTNHHLILCGEEIFYNSSFTLQSENDGMTNYLTFEVENKNNEVVSLAKSFCITQKNPNLHQGKANITYSAASYFINNLINPQLVNSMQHMFYGQKRIELKVKDITLNYSNNNEVSINTINLDGSTVNISNVTFISLFKYINLTNIGEMFEFTNMKIVNSNFFGTNNGNNSCSSNVDELNIMNFVPHEVYNNGDNDNEYLFINRLALKPINNKITGFLFDENDKITNYINYKRLNVVDSSTFPVPTICLYHTVSSTADGKRIMIDNTVNLEEFLFTEIQSGVNNTEYESHITYLGGFNFINKFIKFGNLFTSYQSNITTIYSILTNLYQCKADYGFKNYCKIVGPNNLSFKNLINLKSFDYSFISVEWGSPQTLQEHIDVNTLFDILNCFNFTSNNFKNLNKTGNNYRFKFYKKVNLITDADKLVWNNLWCNFTSNNNVFRTTIFFVKTQDQPFELIYKIDSDNTYRNLNNITSTVKNIGTTFASSTAFLEYEDDGIKKYKGIGLLFSNNTFKCFKNLESLNYAFNGARLNGSQYYPIPENLFKPLTSLKDTAYMFNGATIVNEQNTSIPSQNTAYPIHLTYYREYESSNQSSTQDKYGKQCYYTSSLQPGVNDIHPFRNYKLYSLEYVNSDNGTITAYPCLPPKLFENNSLLRNIYNMFANVNLEGYLPNELFSNFTELETNGLSNFINNAKILPQLINDGANGTKNDYTNVDIYNWNNSTKIYTFIPDKFIKSNINISNFVKFRMLLSNSPLHRLYIMTNKSFTKTIGMETITFYPNSISLYTTPYTSENGVYYHTNEGYYEYTGTNGAVWVGYKEEIEKENGSDKIKLTDRGYINLCINRDYNETTKKYTNYHEGIDINLIGNPVDGAYLIDENLANVYYGYIFKHNTIIYENMSNFTDIFYHIIVSGAWRGTHINENNPSNNNRLDWAKKLSHNIIYPAIIYYTRYDHNTMNPTTMYDSNVTEVNAIKNNNSKQSILQIQSDHISLVSNYPNKIYQHTQISTFNDNGSTTRMLNQIDIDFIEHTTYHNGVIKYNNNEIMTVDPTSITEANYKIYLENIIYLNYSLLFNTWKREGLNMAIDTSQVTAYATLYCYDKLYLYYNNQIKYIGDETHTINDKYKIYYKIASNKTAYVTNIVSF